MQEFDIEKVNRRIAKILHITLEELLKLSEIKNEE